MSQIRAFTLGNSRSEQWPVICFSVSERSSYVLQLSTLHNRILCCLVWFSFGPHLFWSVRMWPLLLQWVRHTSCWRCCWRDSFNAHRSILAAKPFKCVVFHSQRRVLRFSFIVPAHSLHCNQFNCSHTKVKIVGEIEENVLALTCQKLKFVFKCFRETKPGAVSLFYFDAHRVSVGGALLPSNILVNSIEMEINIIFCPWRWAVIWWN